MWIDRMTKQFWLMFLDTLDVFQAILLLIIGYVMGMLTMVIGVLFGFIWKEDET